LIYDSSSLRCFGFSSEQSSLVSNLQKGVGSNLQMKDLGSG